MWYSALWNAQHYGKCFYNLSADPSYFEGEHLLPFQLTVKGWEIMFMVEHK